MAKGKRKGVSSGGPQKHHGPKKKMFHAYSKSIRIEMAKLGMLKKEADSEAMAQSRASKEPKKVVKA